jgi:hypothetical protein
MIELENRWADLDENWRGQYAIGDNPKIVLFNFLHFGNTNMTDKRTFEV